MKTALIVALVAILWLLLYIRLAPTDPSRWHVDPVAANDPGAAGVRLQAGAKTYSIPPGDLFELIDSVIRSMPRTKVLAGGFEDRQITYVIRSKVMGFPDYLTVRVLETDTGGSTLAVLSRLRFGGSDFGVNRARLEAILSGLPQALP